jgi:hypothetical protein
VNIAAENNFTNTRVQGVGAYNQVKFSLRSALER